MEGTPLQPSRTWTLLRRFFANPVVGVAGSIASVVGLVLAVYFFVESQRHRELLYLVHPAKAVIVKAGQLSRLSVNLDGASIDTDVTAAQIAFWNQGNESIRREHILRVFTLRTKPPVPIIDATIRKTSRDVVQIELDKSRFQHGELGLSWNILERSDGAIVQLIFAGSASTDVLGAAVIEGQPSIRRLEALTQDSSDDRYGRANRRLRILVWAYIAVALAMATLGYVRIARRRKQGRPLDRFRLLVFIGMPLTLVFMAIAMALFLKQPEPPFGF